MQISGEIHVDKTVKYDLLCLQTFLGTRLPSPFLFWLFMHSLILEGVVGN